MRGMSAWSGVIKWSCSECGGVAVGWSFAKGYLTLGSCAGGDIGTLGDGAIVGAGDAEVMVGGSVVGEGGSTLGDMATGMCRTRCRRVGGGGIACARSCLFLKRTVRADGWITTDGEVVGG